MSRMAYFPSARNILYCTTDLENGFKKDLFSVCACLACLKVPCACSAHEDQKRALDSP